MTEKIIKAGLFGVAVGDALGVPVEFLPRFTLKMNPVTDMIGYGTYNLPAGTWSDDSSMTFCLVEALLNGYDLNEIAQNFANWKYGNFWTPRGEVFDIGMATTNAIDNYVNGKESGIDPTECGGKADFTNGNGSLMRILPLAFYLKDENDFFKRFEVVKAVSSITHAHISSVIACFYYVEFAILLLYGMKKEYIYKALAMTVSAILESMDIDKEEIKKYSLIFDLDGNDPTDLNTVPQEKIFGNGYVVRSLEASIWCLMTTNSYKEAVLKAVNLGEDTDTTAAITGGLAGLLYGFDDIPAEWVDQLARKEDIEELSNKLYKKLNDECNQKDI